MKKTAPILFLLLLAASAAQAAASAGSTSKPPPFQRMTTPGERVIDQVMAAYGGREILGKVTAYRMEGRIRSSMSNSEAPFTRLFQRPDRLMMDLRYPLNPERRLLVGKLGWRTAGTGALKPVEGFLLDSMILQAARADLPWILDEMKDATTASLKTVGNAQMMLIELPLSPSLLLRVTVDPETHLITESEGVMQNSPMGAGSFVAVYSDYRKVDGILVPFLEKTSAMGQMAGETIIEKVVINPLILEKDFQP